MVATAISELVMKLVDHSEMAVSGVAGLASLHAWLEQELETRGIDAVIYTRYILSILQQDVFVGDDLDSTAENHFFPPHKREGLRAKPLRAGRKFEKRRVVDIADCDQQKKSAAIECLLSLSDEECGIESLVDELYVKLKEQQANITSTDGGSGGTSQSDTAGSSDSDSSEPSVDPAQRYYAAFPALTTEVQPAATTAIPLAPEGGIWAAKVTQGLARSDVLTEVARHAATAKQITPPLHVEITELAENEQGRRDFTQSDCRCSCYGKPMERGRHQRPPPRCNACDNWNNQRTRNKDHTPRKAKRSPQSSSKSGFEKSNSDIQMSLSPYGKLPPRNTKAWKDFEYMRPIFIVPKMHSPDMSTQRVRSVRSNQKTESVLDFFFKSRAALPSPLLGQMCYCGAESIWGCTAGCLNWPEMLGLGADSEDQSWYTEPLDMMVKPSPVPSRRLYNRRSVISSFSTFFEDHLHAFGEALSEEEPQDLDLFGITSLLNRTLEDAVNDVEEEGSETDSFNTAEESVSEIVLEDEVIIDDSYDVFADASSGKLPSDDCEETPEKDVAESLASLCEDGEEVAYPSHIKPHGVHSQNDELLTPCDKTPEPQTLEDGGSGWGSPESQLHWPIAEPPLTAAFSAEHHIPPTPIGTSLVEALWDRQPTLNTDLTQSQLDCLGRKEGAIWGCGTLSPHIHQQQTEDLLNVTNDAKWGFSSSSGSNSISASHASSQDNLYDGGTGDQGLADDQCSCGQPAASLSGGFGLGSRVWETAPSSPRQMQGRMPTPISSENEVLDDRPRFYLPLGDEEDYRHSVEDSDLPLPIPPEFFSDSDDDLTTPPPSLTSSSCQVTHHQSPTQIHNHQNHQPHYTSSSVQDSHHSHSHISSREHVDSWSGQVADDGITPNQTQSSSKSKEVCESSGHGIMASLTCDTLQSNLPISPREALPDVLLTASFPNNSSMWSYCLESFLSPGTASDRSLFVSPFSEDWPSSELFCTLPLSPKHMGSDLSHLWDVNAAHRCIVCESGSDKLAVGVETQNIRRYLMNVRFEVPSQEGRMLDHALCGSLLTSGARSMWETQSPSWAAWREESPTTREAFLTPSTYETADSTSQTTSEQHFTERHQLWQNFERKPQFFRQRSTSADHVETEGETGFQKSLLSGSTGLLPSENSAFCDRIPPRVAHFPHVQSEPALDRQHMPHGRVYNHGRLVQVRSLYKSDTSILEQLGLTSGRVEDPQAGVQVLPHTHFVPISHDPVGGGDGTSEAESAHTAHVGADPHKAERVPTPTGPVPEVCPVLGRQSNYQLYHHPEQEEDEERAVNFVPRFQVQKSTEKFCQTGEKVISTESTASSASPCVEADPDGECPRDGLEVIVESVEQEKLEAAGHQPPVSESGDGQQEALGMFLYDMQDVLELSAEDAERIMLNADTPPFPQLDDEKDEVDYSSDYESMGADQASMEELGRAAIAELWEAGEAGSDVWRSSTTPVLPVEGNDTHVSTAPGTSVSTGAQYRSIWSWGNDSDLPSLPNSFSSSIIAHDPGESLLHWSQTEDEDASLADLSLGIPGEKSGGSLHARLYDLDPHWADDGDDVFIDDPDVQMQLAGIDPNPEPDRVIFSSDLEHHWLNTHTSFTVQIPNPGHHKLSGQRKPCSFFLEGNCRRTDCKFAHDFSYITCRFWEEGNCFKGVTCPFLHGYPGSSESGGSRRSSCEREFILDMEKFPELGSQSEEDPKGVPKRRSGMKKQTEERSSASGGESERRRRRHKPSTSSSSQNTKQSTANSSQNTKRCTSSNSQIKHVAGSSSQTSKHTTAKCSAKEGQEHRDDHVLSTQV